MREQVGQFGVRRLLGEFQQGFASWTSETLRIGKVFVHDPVKYVEQFRFRIHSARPAKSSPRPTAILLTAESHDSLIDVDENLCIPEWSLEHSMQRSMPSETPSGFAAIYR